ncbi:anti-sigma factor family protein [Viridibacillus arvi]|uniref:anti-sigma factor family protein n=1 Tax=Viridibacillus arvi TaxID=263475 RepID=UPI00187BC134|nr:zf-HC2 domain-containing protein [Viridibacillus sp. JNUCC-6]QOV11513.1 zf-HC2 domain-containing protein [Viridibacillus sp. JNUCC-6]
MNCNIIKDLLPSYIDEICSEDTAKLVEGHVQHCDECRQTLKRLQQQMDYVQMVPEEVKKAITPFKKINTKRRIQVIKAIVMTFLMTFFITTVGYFLYQDVGVVHDFFSPKVTAVVDLEDDTQEWQNLKFNDKNYLIYDRVFWKKSIVNAGSNDIDNGNDTESDILLRVKDVNGKVIVDEIQVKSGKSVKLDGLKKNEKYFFEIKAPQGRFFINAF